MSLGRQDHFLQIVLPTTEKDNEGFSVQMDKEVAREYAPIEKDGTEAKNGQAEPPLQRLPTFSASVPPLRWRLPPKCLLLMQDSGLKSPRSKM